jgi:hypothetical protein
MMERTSRGIGLAGAIAESSFAAREAMYMIKG